MVRHLVSWELSDQWTPEECAGHKARIKAELERLPEIIEGIVSIQVITDLLPSSSASLMLDSCFETVEALEYYQKHPEHKKVSVFVRSVIKARTCVDYMV